MVIISVAVDNINTKYITKTDPNGMRMIDLCLFFWMKGRNLFKLLPNSFVHFYLEKHRGNDIQRYFVVVVVVLLWNCQKIIISKKKRKK